MLLVQAALASRVQKCKHGRHALDVETGVVGANLQANLVKQLAKLVKVRYVEDITHSERVGAAPAHALWPADAIQMCSCIHRQHAQHVAWTSPTLLLGCGHFWPCFCRLGGVYFTRRSSEMLGLICGYSNAALIAAACIASAWLLSCA